jgi:hypothetical protein
VGGKWVAWLYTPASSGALAAIELHTNALGLAFLDDRGGGPGSVLFQTQLGPADLEGWRRATPPPNDFLTAGRRYWIAILGSDTDSVACPAAASGVEIETWITHVGLGGPWHKSTFTAPWAARVRRAC